MDVVAANQKKLNLKKDRNAQPNRNSYTVGDLALLIPPRKRNKLSPIYLGPFTVKALLPNDTLQLESIVDSHTLNAHASRVRPFRGTHDKDTIQKIAALDLSEYIVEKVVKHKVEDDILLFRLRWLGYDTDSDIWQPYDEDVIGNERVEEMDEALRPLGKSLRGLREALDGLPFDPAAESEEDVNEDDESSDDDLSDASAGPTASTGAPAANAPSGSTGNRRSGLAFLSSPGKAYIRTAIAGPFILDMVRTIHSYNHRAQLLSIRYE
ncbi:Chromo and chromo shadow domain [Carpediemonas membranifera]|uniref:Chromo and chromo shadow domain n=1 Tax=Carpediemonas membranifera TaxID=201153 RepID=A0A8J6B890_9EUKA|nr:Chromo and chromo shadow domain [Carpediemonas membranifera]|eukprot:KAG9392067.1 Chromo and chromo shadow domain [Carpediemonas membranifera]